MEEHKVIFVPISYLKNDTQEEYIIHCILPDLSEGSNKKFVLYTKWSHYKPSTTALLLMEEQEFYKNFTKKEN